MGASERTIRIAAKSCNRVSFSFIRTPVHSCFQIKATLVSLCLLSTEFRMNFSPLNRLRKRASRQAYSPPNDRHPQAEFKLEDLLFILLNRGINGTTAPQRPQGRISLPGFNRERGPFHH